MSLFSETVKAKRIKMGLKQKELATKLGYTTAQVISNWERGATTPPVKAVRPYSKALKIPAKTLVECLVTDYKTSLTKKVRAKR